MERNFTTLASFVNNGKLARATVKPDPDRKPPENMPRETGWIKPKGR